METRPRVLVAGAAASLLADELRQAGRFLVPMQYTKLADAARGVTQWRPDIVVVDAGPGGPEQTQAVAQIAAEAPYATIIVICQAVDLETATAFMEAGANGYLPPPLRPERLPDYAEQLHRQISARKRHWAEQQIELVSPRRPQVVAVFSPKGGVGKTTLSINLAVALSQVTDQPVTLLDADLEAGDTATLLDLAPRSTLLDYVRALESGDDVDLSAYLTEHPSGVRLIAAPPSPDLAEAVRPLHIRKALTAARQTADYVVADTAPTFSDQVLAVLDEAQVILLLLTPDIAALKNVRTAMEVMAGLGYPPTKIWPVINRHAGDHGLTPAEVERALGRPVMTVIPNDPTVVTTATNAGSPFVLSSAASPVARAVQKLAQRVAAEAPATGGETGAGGAPGHRSRSLWARLLGRR